MSNHSKPGHADSLSSLAFTGLWQLDTPSDPIARIAIRNRRDMRRQNTLRIFDHENGNYFRHSFMNAVMSACIFFWSGWFVYIM